MLGLQYSECCQEEKILHQEKIHVTSGQTRNNLIPIQFQVLNIQTLVL